MAATPMDNSSSAMISFGFSFKNNDFLVVSEAFGGVLAQSAGSSYSSDQAGLLSVITGSLHNSQTAACWVVITNDAGLATVSNTGSGTLSTYNVGNTGLLTLANAVAADLGLDSAPRDMA